METKTITNQTIASTVTTTGGVATASLDVTGFPTVQEVERRYLTLVLEKTGGNKVQAAKILGVSVKTIYNKLDSYNTATMTQS